MIFITHITHIADRFPATMGTIGLAFAGISQWLEGPSALVTLCVGISTLVILSPRIYRQLRIWYRWCRRHLFPRRRRPS